MQYENLNREVVGDEPDLTDILATSYLVVGHTGRMQDLSMTVEKIAAFSRLRLDIMAVEETLEQAKEEIEDLRLAISSRFGVSARDPLAKVALLAALYFLTGKLGPSLALPPGYATIIWPPSGLVLGFLLMHGRQLRARRVHRLLHPESHGGTCAARAAHVARTRDSPRASPVDPRCRRSWGMR